MRTMLTSGSPHPLHVASPRAHPFAATGSSTDVSEILSEAMSDQRTCPEAQVAEAHALS